MKTSSFFVAGRLPGAVSVAYSPPRWFAGERYTLLAPPRRLVEGYKRGEISWETYAAVYNDAVLGDLVEECFGLNPRVVYEQLHVLVVGEPILCCWEPPGEPCHRRLIAAWFEENLGVVVPEMEVAP